MSEDSDFFAALFEKTDDGQGEAKEPESREPIEQSPWVHSSKTPLGGVVRPSSVEPEVLPKKQTPPVDTKHSKLEIDELHYEHLAALDAPRLESAVESPELLFATPRFVTPGKGVEAPPKKSVEPAHNPFAKVSAPLVAEEPAFTIEDFPSAPALPEPDTLSFGDEIIEEYQWEEDPSVSGDGMVSGFSDAFDRALESLPTSENVEPSAKAKPQTSALDLVGESISMDGFSDDGFGFADSPSVNDEALNPFSTVRSESQAPSPPPVDDIVLEELTDDQNGRDEKATLEQIPPFELADDEREPAANDEFLNEEAPALASPLLKEAVDEPAEDEVIDEPNEDEAVDEPDEDEVVDAHLEDEAVEAVEHQDSSTSPFVEELDKDEMAPSDDDRELAKAHQLYSEAVQDLSTKNLQSALVRARMAVAFAPTEKVYKDFLIDLGKMIESQSQDR